MAPSQIVGLPLVSVSGFSADNTANGAYDGATSFDVLSGLGALAVGQTGTVDITVQLDFLSGFPGSANTASSTADQLPEPVTSEAAVPIVDIDGDGVPDSLEISEIGFGGDRDGDGINDAADYDPTGYFYCEDDGSIQSGGLISVMNLATGGVQTGLGRSNNIAILQDGSDGFFQFTVNAAGTYRLIPSYPGTGVPSTTRLANAGALDLTGFLPADPAVLGSGEFGATGQLADSSAAANPFYLDFEIEAGDPSIFNNNLPLSLCGTPVVTASKEVVDGPIVQPDGSSRVVYSVAGENTGNTRADDVRLVGLPGCNCLHGLGCDRQRPCGLWRGGECWL